MPNYDQTGPTGQGPTGRGQGGCRRNMSSDNNANTTFLGGIGRRLRGAFDNGQGRCSGRQNQGQNRKRGPGRR